MTGSTITAPASGALILERLPTVKARTGQSRTSIYRGIAAGTFPAPVKIGPMASAWPHHEISEWIADRIAERDSKARAA